MGQPLESHRDGDRVESQIVTRHSLQEMGARDRVKILLAEDHVVNQKVAVRMLRKLGYGVDVVNNGHQAVEALAHNTYDLVLMDCRMPEMDGFEATRAIRAREAEHRDDRAASVGRKDTNDKRRIPIIAITANAMDRDREKCFAVGMDDFLSKPVMIKELEAMLERWIHGEGQLGLGYSVGQQQGQQLVTHSEESFSGEHPPLDPAVFGELRDLGSDEPAFLPDIIERYLQKAVGHIEEIQQAIFQQDMATLEGVVHTLKGSSGNIGALYLGRLCFELEEKGRMAEHEGVDELLSQVKEEFSRVQHALKAEFTTLASPSS
jgi:CheY-like chemotaxis protein